MVGLLAVGGNHTDVAGVVEQLDDGSQRIVLRTHSAQTHHGPHLNHGRWRDDSGVAGGASRRVVHIDGVAVADGLHPVVDHRLVHRVTGQARLAGPGRLDLGNRFLNVAHPGHLGTLGTLRPDAAIISRMTSFTPPPKVITRLRLVWASSQRSSSAVSGSAGLPYLPTIPSASRPAR
ncbi:Uncharacterised protein [Mycobacterium tuberculosis]|nr:Uncharacterised protein [Mycobacterium tuberculosis]